MQTCVWVCAAMISAVVGVTLRPECTARMTRPSCRVCVYVWSADMWRWPAGHRSGPVTLKTGQFRSLVGQLVHPYCSHISKAELRQQLYGNFGGTYDLIYTRPLNHNVTMVEGSAVDDCPSLWTIILSIGCTLWVVFLISIIKLEKQNC